MQFFCGAAKVDNKPVWGDKIGFCVQAKNKSTGENFSCDSTGFVKDGVTCVCSSEAKIKPGNNGTVSCNNYCAKYQGESYQQCVAGWNNATNDNSDASCTKVPGLLRGKDLTCTCKQPELDFIWSAAGKPNNPQYPQENCVQLTESLPYWNDNWLCSNVHLDMIWRPNKNDGMPASDLKCFDFTEKAAKYFDDDQLCIKRDTGGYELAFLTAGKPNYPSERGIKCIQITEDTPSFNDNYLCWGKPKVKVTVDWIKPVQCEGKCEGNTITMKPRTNFFAYRRN